jgi:hypothetical protein
MVLNELYSFCPLSVHSLSKDRLNAYSGPESMLDFGETQDPINSLRTFCITFLLGKEMFDEIKNEKSRSFFCLLSGEHH